MSLNIELIPLGLYDNYALLFHDQNGRGFVSDPGAAKPVLDYIKTIRYRSNLF